MDSDEKRLSQVNYLIKAASILPSDSHFQKILRSYYLTKCRRLAQSDGSSNKSLFSDEEMCRKCSTPWCDANYSLSLAPVPATNRKARKFHKQIEKRWNRKNNVAKKLSKVANNIMTIKCNLCKMNNKVILLKKSSDSPKQDSSTNEANLTKKAVQKEIANKIKEDDVEPVSTKKAKKKRKRDKNARLLFSLQKDTNPTKTIASINHKLTTLNIQNTKCVPIQRKPELKQSNKNKTKPQEKSKSNLKNAKNTANKITKKIPRPIAKRNNLLQLANALKSKSKQSSSSSPVDKLKQLLR